VLGGRTESHADVNQLEWRGDLIVTGTDDGYVRLWNADGTLQFEKLAAHGVGVGGVTFDPQGTSLTVLTFDGVIQTWGLHGELVATETDPAKPWRALIDPAGKRLLTLNTQGASEIRELGTHDRKIQLFGHLGHVSGAAWSPDGKVVLTTGPDGTFRFWDSATGDPLQILHHTGHATWVDFAPDGRYLAAEDDGYALVGEPPAYAGDRDAFLKLLRCRVPFEVRDDRLQLRAKMDRSSCDAHE
jgi:WD40 repeat protein